MSGDGDNFAPVATECAASDLPVRGELPPELNGTLFRNGPNPQFPSDHHWFLGDGMIHAFTLTDGRASYRNRWVRTPKFLAEKAAGHGLDEGWTGGGVANTNIVAHAGRLLALEEMHAPIEIDAATLETSAPHPLGGDAPVTAHPKIDPETGELRFFGYCAAGPLSSTIRWGTVDRSGRTGKIQSFEAPYCSMVHDFIATERFIVFPIMPLAGNLQRAMSGGPAFAWDPELGAHLGVMRADIGVRSLRWFRADTGFVFHVMNAWEEGGRILADVMRYEEPPLFPRADGTETDPARTRAFPCRWTIDPEGGTDAFSTTRLDDLAGEFPRIDDRRAGRAYRHGWFAGSRQDPFDTLAHLDRATGRRTMLQLPVGDATSEPVFVPRAADAPEGDGWLLAVIWRGGERRSELIVLRADAIGDDPIATVELPQRVPFGFHGNWSAAS